MIMKVMSDLCVGCRNCELACSFAHYGHFNPQQAAIRVVFNDEGQVDVRITVAACSSCSRSLCVEFCPTGAINPS